MYVEQQIKFYAYVINDNKVLLAFGKIVRQMNVNVISIQKKSF